MTPEDRERFFDVAHVATPIIAAPVGPTMFLVATDDAVVGRLLFTKGSRGDMGLVARVIDILTALGLRSELEGKSFLDVGANIGTTTVAALRSGIFSDVVAFEPEPRNLRLLRVNLVLNDLDDRVRVLPVALSRDDGTAELAIHPKNSGGHQVVEGAGPSGVDGDAPGSSRLIVEKASIDALVKRGMLDPARVGVMWVDVQGHEGHVLRGARELTSKGVPVVVEVYPLMLNRSGGMTLLAEVARKRYTHFLDLRGVTRETDFKAALLPAEELSSYAARYSKHAEQHFTDILLVRMP